MANNIFKIEIPRSNVNEDTVTLVNWVPAHGDYVEVDDLICLLETSKGLYELPSENEGILYRLAPENRETPVGSLIGLLGPDHESIEKWLKEQKENTQLKEAAPTETEKKITPKARSLAERHNLDPEKINFPGVIGAIKEVDIKRYLNQQEQKTTLKGGNAEEISPTPELELTKYAQEVGELSRLDKAVANTLKWSKDNCLLTTFEAEWPLAAVSGKLEALQQKHGPLYSLLPVVLAGLAKVLPQFPLITTAHNQNKLYRYRDLDVAFIAKNIKGKLFAPVVRGLDKLSLEQIAKTCMGLNKEVIANRIKSGQMEGACFTVSYISGPYVHGFAALPNKNQSAILAVSDGRKRLVLKEGRVVEEPVASLVFTYDHTILDGNISNIFLTRLIKTMDSVL